MSERLREARYFPHFEHYKAYPEGGRRPGRNSLSHALPRGREVFASKNPMHRRLRKRGQSKISLCI